jgi:hypothetical protein
MLDQPVRLLLLTLNRDNSLAAWHPAMSIFLVFNRTGKKKPPLRGDFLADSAKLDYINL